MTTMKINKEFIRKYSKPENSISKHRKEFLSMMSHEFRAPLAVIQGSLDLLEETMICDPSQDGLIEIQKIKRALGRVNDLLKIFIERERESYVFNNKHLNLTSIENYFEILLDKVRIIWPDRTFLISSLNCTGSIYVDAAYLNIAFVNLFENAAKYSLPQTEVLIEYYAKNGFLFISIVNQTDFADSEELKHYFEKFYRGKKSKDSRPGDGIGLWLACRIVEQQGGAVSLDFYDGRFKVSVCFPLNNFIVQREQVNKEIIYKI
ncbi:MAG: HAMP domain-containing histidine kinase [Chlorobaculum sp.]|nr:HAMP domain-containing histidine kinase [Chlorobaculum sp.]